MAHSPDLRPHVVGGFVGAGCFGAFSAVTGLIALAGTGTTTLGFSEFRLGGLIAGGFFIVPALMSLVSGALAVAVGRKMKAFASVDLDRRPAVVRDERVRSSGDSTRNLVMLESSDGRREDLRVGSRTAGRVVRDDAGVVYLKAGHVVDFRRIDL